VKNGQLIAVPGATVDYKYVFQWLRIHFESLGINIDVVAYDRWRIKQAKADAESVDFYADEWVEIGQGYKDVSPRVEYFEKMLLQENIRHGSHPLLNMAAANAIAITDPARNRKLDKSKSTQRIDPLVAAVMATGVFMIAPNEFDVSALIG
jgi:phage terminase large subunit-like protein